MTDTLTEFVDQLDKAGQTILQLLHKAAGVAEENSRHALDTAQKLSEQLRDAEDRIAEVEAEITAQRDRAASNGSSTISTPSSESQRSANTRVKTPMEHPTSRPEVKCRSPRADTVWQYLARS